MGSLKEQALPPRQTLNFSLILLPDPDPRKEVLQIGQSPSLTLLEVIWKMSKLRSYICTRRQRLAPSLRLLKVYVQILITKLISTRQQELRALLGLSLSIPQKKKDRHGHRLNHGRAGGAEYLQFCESDNGAIRNCWFCGVTSLLSLLERV